MNASQGQPTNTGTCWHKHRVQELHTGTLPSSDTAAAGPHRRGGTTASSTSEVSPVKAASSAGSSQPRTASAATVFNRWSTGLRMLRASSRCKLDKLEGR